MNTTNNRQSRINSLTAKTLIAGTLSSLLYLYLALNSQHYGDASLSQMLWVCFGSAGLCFFVWYQHHANNTQISISCLLGFAVIFRVIGISAFPVLEDDMYRYLWDARMTIETGSPYNIAPSTFFDDSTINERFEHILDLINYPDIATVYGPMSQWLFALAYIISPGEIWPLQLILSLADIAIILVLIKLSKPNNVLLYAWCPLIIKEFAFTAHPDVLGAMFMVLALLMVKKQHMISVGVLLACAAGVKVFALLITPFLLRFHARGWLAFILTACLIALPFGGPSGIGDTWVPEGLKAMGSNWLFNAPIYQLFSNWLSISTIKFVLIAALALGAGAYLLFTLIYRQNNDQVRGDLLFAALLLATPAFNPWYMVWLLPFAVLRPSLWAWVASVSLLLSYATGINLGNSDLNLSAYQLPSWVITIEFLVILIAACWSWWLTKQGNHQQTTAIQKTNTD